MHFIIRVLETKQKEEKNMKLTIEKNLEPIKNHVKSINGCFFILIKTDKNGTQFYKTNFCPKCLGQSKYKVGKLDHLSHIDNGICWKCGGTGLINKHIVKFYTEAYLKELRDKELSDKENAKQNAKVVSTIYYYSERTKDGALKFSFYTKTLEEMKEKIANAKSKVSQYKWYKPAFKETISKIETLDKGLGSREIVVEEKINR